jgi:hypothetical protein
MEAIFRSPLKCFHLNGQTKPQRIKSLTTIKDACLLPDRRQLKTLQAVPFGTTNGTRSHVLTAGSINWFSQNQFHLYRITDRLGAGYWEEIL